MLTLLVRFFEMFWILVERNQLIRRIQKMLYLRLARSHCITNSFENQPQLLLTQTAQREATQLRRLFKDLG